MAKLPPFPGTTGRRDWRTAFDAIRKLLANGDDTTQVFRIMRAPWLPARKPGRVLPVGLPARHSPVRTAPRSSASTPCRTCRRCMP